MDLSLKTRSQHGQRERPFSLYFAQQIDILALGIGKLSGRPSFQRQALYIGEFASFLMNFFAILNKSSILDLINLKFFHSNNFLKSFTILSHSFNLYLLWKNISNGMIQGEG